MRGRGEEDHSEMVIGGGKEIEGKKGRGVNEQSKKIRIRRENNKGDEDEDG